MNMGPPPMDPGGKRNDFKYDRVPPPRSFGDLPRYLKELLGGFFYRLFYIFGLVWKTGPWILFFMMFIALFDGIMPVIGSLISREIINTFQGIIESDTIDRTSFEVFASMVLVLLIFLFSYRILNRIVSNIKNAVTRIAGEKVVRQVRIQIMEKAKTIDLECFDTPDFYEKLENANREAGNRPINILNSTFSMVSAVINLVSYIIVISTVMWWAALIIIAVSVPSAIINFIYRRKNFNYMRYRSKDRRQMNYYSGILVNKDLVKEVKMFSLGDTFIGKYKEVFDRYYAGLRKLILHENAWHIVIAIVSASVNCFLYANFAWMVFKGSIKIGDYTLFTGALTSVASSVTSLISLSASIYEGTLFIDNLISFLKVESKIKSNTRSSLSVGYGKPHTIEFKNVSFKYPGSDKYVIDNVNLKFRPGETVVLVGLNGAGKTTLIKLLTRLYDPTEGEILLDGKNLKEYDAESLYKMFGIIFQDFGKYAVSVTENIHFGDIGKEINADEIKAAAIQSNADAYISKLPEGYDTPLMKIFERSGTELSIGQWQKLAIARAFYSDSDILILDEPTASLDPIAEQEIFNEFDRLRSGKMSIFVSHRLSSATVASKIVVLEYGKVIEEGTHKDLMASGGRYYELFSTQAKRYIEENNGFPACENDITHEKQCGQMPGHGKETNGKAPRGRRADAND